MRSPSPVAWGSFDDPFLDGLASDLAGKRVLEVFAGNGLLASKLAARGIDIVATTLFSGHDGHEAGMHHAVIEMDAEKAVRQYGHDADVLLMSWPVSSDAAIAAVLRWGADRPVYFLGEVTDLSRNQLGGCASDLFFQLVDEGKTIPGYGPRNMLEKALVYRLDTARVNAWMKREPPENHTPAGTRP